MPKRNEHALMRIRSQSSKGSPAFYGLDFMANKAFRRKYWLNIPQIYKFRNYYNVAQTELMAVGSGVCGLCG